MDTSGESITTRRRSRFVNGWRVALRLARRELHAHRGRALLAATLIGLPVLLVAAALTVYTTYERDGVENIPSVMGQTQAALRVEAGGAMIQAPDPNDGMMQAPGAKARSRAVTEKRLHEITGGRLLPTSETSVRVDLGERRPRGEVLGIDGRDRAYGGMAELTSGRWPRSSQEVVVTERGERQGIPTSGMVTIENDKTGGRRSLRVVGTASAPTWHSLIALPSRASGTQGSSYLLDRDAPVTWAQVQELNRVGVLVTSRYVLTHPDTATTPPEFDDRSNDGVFFAMLAAGGVLLVSTLAAPAFSMSGERQRRMLAQLGSNGAPRAVLRRVVLGEALLVGAATAVVATAAGVGIGLAAVPILKNRNPDRAWGPTDVPVGLLSALAGAAIVAALVAALVPAIRASRTRLIQVLRGHVSPRRVRAGLPVLGLLIVGGSAAVLFTTFSGSPQGAEGPVAICALGIFVGALLVLPWALVQVGRLGGRAPVSVRLAVRDVSRQRGRAVAAVAAVLGVCGLLTTVSISGASDAEQARRDYNPSAPYDHGRISGDSRDLASAERVVRQEIPGARVRTIGKAGEGSQEWPQTSAHVVLPAGTRCAPLKIINFTCSSEQEALSITVMPVDLVRQYANLGAKQTAQLSAGKVLQVVGYTERVVQAGWGNGGVLPKARRELAVEWGSVTRAKADPESDERRATAYRRTGHARLPVMPLRLDLGAPLLSDGATIVMTPETAKKHGIPVHASALDVSHPDGISPQQETAVSDRLSEEMQVERGPEDYSTKVLRILAAVLAVIALVAAVTSTALMQAEGRSDQATLAAIGARPRIRRKVAAAQAATIALVGVLVGGAAGVIPGVALARPLTTDMGGPWVIDIPWENLAAVVVGVPLIAAAVASLMVRAVPDLTRRRS